MPVQRDDSRFLQQKKGPMSSAQPKAKRSYGANDPSDRRYDQWPPAKKALYEAALDLFYEKGFDTTSVGEICARAGLTKGALYHYFASKDDLLWACMVHALQQILPDLRTITEKRLSAAETLREFIASSARTMKFHRREITVFLAQWRRSENVPAEIVESRDEYQSMLIEMIKVGINAGEIRAVGSPRTIAFALDGLASHPQLWWGADSTDEVEDTVAAIVFNGLLAEKPASTQRRVRKASTPRGRPRKRSASD
jgi:AcrR family transcriptional regulator